MVLDATKLTTSEIASLIKLYCKLNAITGKDLAERFGVTYGSFRQMIYAGEVPKRIVKELTEEMNQIIKGNPTTEVLLRLGWTQKDLAKFLQVHPNTINDCIIDKPSKHMLVVMEILLDNIKLKDKLYHTYTNEISPSASRVVE